MVRKSTRHRDPIGSASEAQSRVISRQSLRRHIVENKSDAQNTDQLLEYNPKLVDVTPTTRIAYAKFMTPKIKKEIRFEDANATFDDENQKPSSVLKGRDSLKKLDVTALKERAAIIRAASVDKTEKIDKVENVEPKIEDINISPVTIQPSTSSQAAANNSVSVEKKDFRSRTPIEEESSDERATPESMLNVDRRESKSSLSAATPQIIPSPLPEPELETSSPIVNIEAPSPVPDADIDDEAVEKDEPEDEDAKEKDDSQTSTSLSAPPEEIVHGSPALRSDKGKSKITGKTLTGWL